IQAGTIVSGAACPAAPLGGAPIVVNPADAATLLVCLSLPSIAANPAVMLTFSSAPLIPAAFVTVPPSINGQTTISAAAQPTGTVPPPLGNGIGVTFTARYDGTAGSF